MIFSINQSEIPDILIHQLESFSPIGEEERVCINEQLGGAFKIGVLLRAESK